MPVERTLGSTPPFGSIVFGGTGGSPLTPVSLANQSVRFTSYLVLYSITIGSQTFGIPYSGGVDLTIPFGSDPTINLAELQTTPYSNHVIISYLAFMYNNVYQQFGSPNRNQTFLEFPENRPATLVGIKSGSQIDALAFQF